MTEEVGKGLSVPDVKPDADGKIRLPVVYRIDGNGERRSERASQVRNAPGRRRSQTQIFLPSNERGIICWARINLDGELIKFNPPQTMIADAAQAGRELEFRWTGRRFKSASAL